MELKKVPELPEIVGVPEVVLASAADIPRTIRKVASGRLQTMGFVKLRDRHWVFDGGWWLLHLSFHIVSGRGAQIEIGVQSLADWRPYITFGHFTGTKTFAAMGKNDAELIGSLEHQLELALAMVLPFINQINSPGDLLNHRLMAHAPKTFRTGMLLALAGRTADARVNFDAVTKDVPSITWHRIERDHAASALKLLDKRDLLYDFAHLLILRSRSAIHPLDDREVASYPWLVRVS